MNRINQLFQDSPKNLLSIYFCAGCPTLEGTADVIRTLERNGVHSRSEERRVGKEWRSRRTPER